MGVLGEFLIICAAALAGALLSLIPGFPLPGAVMGMILLFIFLLSGIIKMKYIQRAADFFLGFLALFFIPLVVNLLRETDVMVQYGWKLIIIIILTTLLTLSAAGFTAMFMLRLTRKKGGQDD